MSMRFKFPNIKMNGSVSLEEGDIVQIDYVSLFKKTHGTLVFGRIEYSAKNNSYYIYNDRNQMVSVGNSSTFEVIEANEHLITIQGILDSDIKRRVDAPCVVLCKNEAETAFYSEFFSD